MAHVVMAELCRGLVEVAQVAREAPTFYGGIRIGGIRIGGGCSRRFNFGGSGRVGDLWDAFKGFFGGLFGGGSPRSDSIPQWPTPGVLLPTGSLILTHGQEMSNGAFSRLGSHVRASGIPGRILYVKAMGRRYLVDGNHRVIAARILGIEVVPAQRVFLPFRGYRTMEDLFMGRGW